MREKLALSPAGLKECDLDCYADVASSRYTRMVNAPRNISKLDHKATS